VYSSDRAMGGDKKEKKEKKEKQDKKEKKDKKDKKRKKEVKKSEKERGPTQLSKWLKGSDSESESSEEAARDSRSGRRIKRKRSTSAADEAAEVRRAALLASLNGDDGETLKKAAEDKVPKSKYERALAELFKDKEGMHKIMLAEAEHAKLQLDTGYAAYLGSSRAARRR